MDQNLMLDWWCYAFAMGVMDRYAAWHGAPWGVINCVAPRW